MADDEQPDIFGDDTHGNDLSKGADLSEIDSARWPRAMAVLVDVFTAEALRQGLAKSQAEAEHLARWVVLMLGEYAGGRQIYLPKGDALKAALRDTQIWQEFSGQNVDALAAKYRLTSVRIYKIIAQQRALHRAKVQPQLPFNGVANGH